MFIMINTFQMKTEFEKCGAAWGHLIYVYNIWSEISVKTQEPHRDKNGIIAYAKTKAQISFAATAKLISAFVFTTQIVHFLLYPFAKFQASSLLLYCI